MCKSSVTEPVKQPESLFFLFFTSITRVRTGKLRLFHLLAPGSIFICTTAENLSLYETMIHVVALKMMCFSVCESPCVTQIVITKLARITYWMLLLSHLFYILTTLTRLEQRYDFNFLMASRRCGVPGTASTRQRKCSPLKP